MKTIFFDFDGVIVDTFAMCHGISDSISPVSAEEYKKRFEGNINDAVRKPPVRKADFFEEYVPKLMNCVPYEGMAEAIKELAQTNSLFVVSSTITAPIKAFLEKNGLGACFKEVLGNDVEKSKIKKIEMILEKYQVQPSDTIFITDTLGDVREASHCSVKSVAVTWGYHHGETLEKGEPYKIIHEVKGLVPAVKEYFAHTV